MYCVLGEKGRKVATRMTTLYLMILALLSFVTFTNELIFMVFIYLSKRFRDIGLKLKT
jgi:hypothetical protein